MKKIMYQKLFIAFLLTLMGLQLQAQNYAKYYELCNEALIDMVTEDYDNAIKNYKKAFKYGLPFPDDMQNVKNCYLAIGEKKESISNG